MTGRPGAHRGDPRQRRRRAGRRRRPDGPRPRWPGARPAGARPPELDDRTTTPDPEIAPLATWTYDDNVTGWGALLGEAHGTDDVSPYAAPARATELAGLPPAYVEVGQNDAFRDEDVAHARRLAAAGVSTELHVHPGCPHAFEAFAPDSDVARRSTADRVRTLRSL